METLLYLENKIMMLPEGNYMKNASKFQHFCAMAQCGHVQKYDMPSLKIILTAVTLLGLDRNNMEFLLKLGAYPYKSRYSIPYLNLLEQSDFVNDMDFYTILIVTWHYMENCYMQICQQLWNVPKGFLYEPAWRDYITIENMSAVIVDDGINLCILDLT